MDTAFPPQVCANVILLCIYCTCLMIQCRYGRECVAAFSFSWPVFSAYDIPCAVVVCPYSYGVWNRGIVLLPIVTVSNGSVFSLTLSTSCSCPGILGHHRLSDLLFPMNYKTSKKNWEPFMISVLEDYWWLYMLVNISYLIVYVSVLCVSKRHRYVCIALYGWSCIAIWLQPCMP